MRLSVLVKQLLVSGTMLLVTAGAGVYAIGEMGAMNERAGTLAGNIAPVHDVARFGGTYGQNRAFLAQAVTATSPEAAAKLVDQITQGAATSDALLASMAGTLTTGQEKAAPSDPAGPNNP